MRFPILLLFIITLLFSNIKTFALKTEQNIDNKVHNLSMIGNDDILLINNYYCKHPWSTQIQNNLRESILESMEMRLNVDNIVCSPKFTYDNCKNQFRRIFRKYREKPKAVVFIGEQGWELYKETMPNDWKDIPVVLTMFKDSVYSFKEYKENGLSQIGKAMAIEESCKDFNATLIKADMSTENTIELMKTLSPALKRIVFIVDYSYKGSVIRKRMEQKQSAYPDLKFVFYDNREMTTTEMFDSIQNLNNNSSVIFCSWQLIPAEMYYHPDNYILYRYITSIMSVPSYITTDMRAYHDMFIGGVFVGASDISKAITSTLCEITMKPMKDKVMRVKDITDALNTHIDYNILTRCSLDEDKLARHSNIIYSNKPLTFFEANRDWLEILTIILITSSIVFIYNFLKTRKVRNREHKLIHKLAELYDTMPILHIHFKLIYNDKGEVSSYKIIYSNLAYNQHKEQYSQKPSNGENIKTTVTLSASDCEILENVVKNKQVHINTWCWDLTGRHYQVHLYPTENIDEIYIFYTDITDFVKAQQTISQFKNKIMSLYKNLPIAVILLNDKLKALDCNKAFSEMVGISDDFAKNSYIDAMIMNLFSDEDLKHIVDQKFIPKEISLDISKDNTINTHCFWCISEKICTDDDSNTDSYVLLFINHNEINRIIEKEDRLSLINNRTLAEILDKMPTAISIKDADDEFKYVYWNKKSIELWDVPIEKIIGFTDYDFYPECADIFRKEDIDLLAGKKTTIKRENVGNDKIYSTRKSIISGKDNHRWIITFIWNVTKQRKAEKQIAQAKEITEDALNRCKTILSSIDIGIVYIDINFVVLLSSVQQFERLFPNKIYKENTVCHKHMYGLDSSCKDCPIQKMFNQKSIVNVEANVNGVDLLIAAIPVYDKKGLIIGGILRLVDVTQQRSFEYQLQESTIRLSMALELGNITPWSWNIELDDIYFFSTDKVSVAHTETSKFFEIAQSEFRRTIIEEDKYIYDECFDSIRANKSNEFKFTVRSNCFTTDYKWYQIQGIVNEKNMMHKNSRVIGFIQDVTQVKEAEYELIVAKERAEEANRLKSAFLANMSHEIRTPLNAIVGFSEVLVDAETEEERQAYSRHIAINNDILLQLISDILDLSKIESQTLDFVFSEVDINLLLDGIYAQSYRRLKNTDVQIIKEFGMQKCIVSTEKIRFMQVITNLINNAIKFTEKGSITMGYKLLHSRDMLYFYVKDTGCGIPKNKIESIFERFVKLNDFVQGTGLGLAICKTIVERLGGEMNVESSVGEGSIFSFTIPYKRINNTKNNILIVNEHTQIPSQDKQHRQKVILIAEDTTSNYILFETILRGNYNLLHAIDGLEAVDMFNKYRPDLVLMDIKMPNMDGIEATQIIRMQDSKIPIIAVTGNTFIDNEESMLRKGFSAFLSKPIKKNKFLSLVNEYLS